MGKQNMEEYIYNSCHSYIRAKQRAGLNRKRAERMIDLARKRGIESDECSWAIDKRFLDRKSDVYTKAVAYNGYCFIFDRNSYECVTIFPLPKCFGKKKTFYKSSCKDYMLKYAV